jgi:hypothetical protein
VSIELDVDCGIRIDEQNQDLELFGLHHPDYWKTARFTVGVYICASTEKQFDDAEMATADCRA